MAVFACTSCGWVRRASAPVAEARCPRCEGPARALTPAGTLSPGRAAVAAATARALHAPGVVPLAPAPEAEDQPAA